MKFIDKLLKYFERAINELQYKHVQNRFRVLSEVDYFRAYLYFINNSIYYNRFEYFINDVKIKGKYLNEKVNNWIKNNIFIKIYEYILDDYKVVNKTTKHVYQDGHIITNKYGVSNKGRCVYYKSKNAYNLQILANDEGCPFGSSINGGNKYEGKLLIDLVNKSYVDDATKYKNSKRYKQYFVVDSGYDQEYNHSFLKQKGYIPLIWYNKRNTKDEQKIKKRKFNKRQMKHYKTRHIVETVFSWLECKVPRLAKMFDKKPTNYLNMVYIASADLILGKLVRLN